MREARAVKEYRVTCICRADDVVPPSDITHIGNSHDRWLMPRETVIQHLELGTAVFYVLDPVTGQRSVIGFAREAGRLPYLFSHVEGRCNAQLWSLEVVASSPPVFV